MHEIILQNRICQSLQTLEVSNQVIYVLIAEGIVWIDVSERIFSHNITRLEFIGISQPFPQIIRVHIHDPGSHSGPTAQMG